MDDADSDAARCYNHINKWNKYQYMEGITCALL